MVSETIGSKVSSPPPLLSLLLVLFFLLLPLPAGYPTYLFHSIKQLLEGLKNERW